jgi:hypothetical protein
MTEYQSEIRASDIQALEDRVARSTSTYRKYLKRLILKRVRGFTDREVTFDFPVTALIGPNGGGQDHHPRRRRPGVPGPRQSAGMSGSRAGDAKQCQDAGGVTGVAAKGGGDVAVAAGAQDGDGEVAHSLN